MTSWEKIGAAVLQVGEINAKAKVSGNILNADDFIN